ncbi:MAG: ECF transporter S component [Oscillibacter sp.]|jgi:uncharacterized membrane protein|nr:ECF transporter S component [Oscillibacter sp.]
MEKTLQSTSKAHPQDRTKLVVMTGLLAALTCVATMVIKIGTPTGGYLNLGDTTVLLGACLLGPVYGAVAGGVGSAMADLLNGYVAWMPATLVIKAVMALAAGLLYRKLRGRPWGVAVSGIVGEIPMVAGYWLYESWMLGSFAGAAAGVPGNLAQAAFGVAASTLLILALRKSAYVRREFSNL